MSFRLNKNFDNAIPFLTGYKQLKIPIVDNTGNPAWPELFPIKKIHELEQIVGTRHFSAQMMLEYVPEERIHLDPGALCFYDDEFDTRSAKIGEYIITGASLYWDPSNGRTVSDGSVCALIYRDDKSKKIFVHDILYICVDENDLHPLTTQCLKVLSFMQKYKINRIGIEINGLGNALPEIMRQMANTKNILIHIVQISNHIKKETRILNAVEPVLNTGRLYMHNKIKQTVLLSEMLAWTPIGSTEHDDGLDAVAGAIAMMPGVVRPVSQSTLINANTEFKI